jgi:hypothetical protein
MSYGTSFVRVAPGQGFKSSHLHQGIQKRIRTLSLDGGIRVLLFCPPNTSSDAVRFAHHILRATGYSRCDRCMVPKKWSLSQQPKPYELSMVSTEFAGGRDGLRLTTESEKRSTHRHCLKFLASTSLNTSRQAVKPFNAAGNPA